MPVTQPPVRFGLFELDPGAGELTKNGRKLKLQEQPLRLLGLLLEHPGQTVARERLKEALWPADTFVDFDHSLNAAVAKLRQALGDSAENPRFIETQARRGYRFIAPVDFPNGTGGAAASLPEPVKPVRLGSLFMVAGIAGIAAVAIVTLWLWRRPQPVRAQLVRLTNDTGLTMDPAVSPDGRLLAYASDRADGRNLNIWVQQLEPGGSSVQLTHFDSDTSEPSFSPDGSKTVFRSAHDGGGIYVIPTIGGEPTRLAPRGRNPRYSPDGQWIAYWSGAYGASVLAGDAGGEVYVLDAQGGQPHRIGSDLTVAGNPVWSPDAKHVLVNGWKNEQLSDWWIVSLDGSPSRQTGILAALRQQGFSYDFDRIPRLSQWNSDSILFSAAYGDAVTAWRMPISASGHSLGPAERLTSGTSFEVAPRLTPAGDLVFASLNLNSAVWSLPVDADHARITGNLKRVTDSPLEIMPSISQNGRLLATSGIARGATASRSRDGHLIWSLFAVEPDLQVHLTDLWTGEQSVASIREHAAIHPQISRDGTMITYGADDRIYIDRVSGGSRRVIARGTGKSGEQWKSWDWSSDNRVLLFGKADGRIFLVDVITGRQSVFLSHPEYDLFQAKFSPDGQSLAVNACDAHRVGMECWVFLVPLKADGTPDANNWIRIDHPTAWDDKPRWSPDGSLIYYISDRDGHLCLWAQRLAGRAKQPAGAPFPVYHFHNSKLAMINVGTASLEIDVARDKVVMSLGELTGNIWSLKR
jgi:Tol biopolymer transport system component/DNA-binding winged helix-turn-helix (wHTH) protein